MAGLPFANYFISYKAANAKSVTDSEQKTAQAFSPTSGLWGVRARATFDASEEHVLLIAHVMVNVNSYARNNCTRTMHNPHA